MPLRNRSDHGARPSGNRRSAELRISYAKNTAFRASAIFQKCITYETSFKNASCRCVKCCACHDIGASRFTKCCACHDICAWRFTKCCACHEICTLRFTKCCACHEICKLHMCETKQCCERSFQNATCKGMNRIIPATLPCNLQTMLEQ